MQIRKIILVTALFLATQVQAANLPDYIKSDFKSSSEAALKDNKNILLVFSTDWCGPCQMMVKDVYPLEEVKKGLANYVFAYIDAEKEAALARRFKVEAYPTFVVLTKQGEELGRFSGGIAKAQLFLSEVEKAKSAKAEQLKSDKKLQDLNQSLKSIPSAALYSERAEIYVSREDYTAALNDFKEGAKLDKGNELQLQGNVLYMDTALNNGNDPKVMAKVCEEVVEKYPKCSYAVMARYNLVQIYGNFINDNKKAEMHAKAFLKDYPTHAAASDVEHMLLHFTGVEHEEPH